MLIFGIILALVLVVNILNLWNLSTLNKELTFVYEALMKLPIHNNKPFTREDLHRFTNRLEELQQEQSRQSKNPLEDIIKRAMEERRKEQEEHGWGALDLGEGRGIIIPNRDRRQIMDDLEDGLMSVESEDGDVHNMYMSPQLREDLDKNLEEQAYWQILPHGAGARIDGENEDGTYTEEQHERFKIDPHIHWCTLDEAMKIAEKNVKKFFGDDEDDKNKEEDEL